MRAKGLSQAENVRMGPLALFTLVSVICLAVLAALSMSTANAALALSQRRAVATSQLYLDEVAAQTFLATLDAALGDGADPEEALSEARAAAIAASPDTPLEVVASYEAPSFSASFDCGNSRRLEIEVRMEEDGSLSVRRWRFTSVQNDEPTMGELLGSS